MQRLVERVIGRGACAHPDGTARLVTSLLASYGDEAEAHALGRCTFRLDAADTDQRWRTG